MKNRKPQKEMFLFLRKACLREQNIADIRIGSGIWGEMEWNTVLLTAIGKQESSLNDEMESGGPDRRDKYILFFQTTSSGLKLFTGHTLPCDSPESP